MAARHVVVLAFLAVLLPFPIDAEFLNEDLVFEEPASPPRWRPVRHKRTVYNQEINSLDIPLAQDPRYSESETGLWNSAVNSIRRLKRNFWDYFSDSSEVTAQTSSSETTVEVRAVSITDPETTSEPHTSNTLSRDTRSTDDAEEFTQNQTNNEYLASLRDDDDDFNNIDGNSGDSSGVPLISTEFDITSSTSEYPTITSLTTHQIVYHRVTLAVNEIYEQDFADRNSASFKVFAEEFSSAVDALLDSTPGTQKSSVINIERDDDPFILIVTLDISSENYNNPDEIKNLLEERIAKYRSFGKFSLSPDNFKFTDYGARVEPLYPPKEPCGPGEIHCTTTTGDTCVGIEARCNGIWECTDGSDEAGCPSTTTESTTTSTTTPSTTSSTDSDPRSLAPKPIDDCRADDKVRCADNSVVICSDQQCDGTPDCPDGDDEKSCPPEKTDCTSDQFLCDFTQCIPQNEVCDGVQQCTDGADEQNCPKPACNKDREFQCEDGTCIDIRRKCDGEYDCRGTGSDERDCPSTSHCKPGEFHCANDHCIASEHRCDGTHDCQDGTDELNCNVTCTTDQFRCTSGACIDKLLRCNSVPNCPDGTDEQGCDSSSCRTDEFRCNDGYCLPVSVLCNNRPECRDGEDERNCPSPMCQSYELQCRDRKGCYRQSQKCDAFPDCADASDEENCAQPCGSNELTCGDGSCVPLVMACDGTRDCKDGADERDCSFRCRQDEFLCDGSRCVPVYKKCDRQRDCIDQTDEANCGFQQCTSDQFTCGDGSCIPLSSRCDRRQVDCRDGSDEQGCPGSQVTPAPVSCSSSQFACANRIQCVPISAHCNTINDCEDKSDEANCAGSPDGLNLKTYPAEQTIKESREVVFQCRDEGPLRASVRWTRGDGLPLPPSSRDIKGRLEMPNIQLEHMGTYTCEATGFSPSTPGSRASVHLTVEPFAQQPYPTKASCAISEATCSNGECISKSKVCDGRYDCTDGSDELRCKPYGCEPNEFRCDNKKCVQKTWRCDSDDDCGDNSDERNCEPSPPGSKCRYNEYQCSKVDQCIPKAFHCDMEIDCQDGTDEYGCRKSEILKPPPSMVVKQPGETFTINCTAVGVPTPEVVWRLNWGHIPNKCRTTSVDGFGTLICPNIQESDQGAYSCEALNNQGSKFAIPDAILVVKPDRTVCPAGTFNELARSYDECIPCFCFGISTTCRSADLFIYQLPPPLNIYRVVNVYIPPGGGLDVRKGESSQFQASVHPTGRTGFQISLTDNELKSSYYNPVYPYFALPETYLGNQLKSYGGYIKYTVKSDGTSSSLPIPDIILTGNGITLVYRGTTLNPRVENSVNIRLFPGNWYKVQPDARLEAPAVRQDLMMVLEELDQLLIRTQYFSDGLETTISDINMDSAAFTNHGQGQAAYVEQCSCPVGYSGLSCESCTDGFMHRPGSWLGTCEGPVKCPPKYYKDPRDNRCKPCSCPHTDSSQFGIGCRLDWDSDITCDCPPGYEGRKCEKCSYPLYEGNPLLKQPCVRRQEPECDPAGSLSTRVDPYTGRCICKEHATGPKCDQCKPNTFNFASGNLYGCINCFCMGINTTCTSSDLYRTQIASAFTRDNQGFKLAEANRLSNPITDVQVNPSTKEIYFQQFNPGVYYWVLPSKFLHNKVTSYGGYLRYTLRYIPTPGGQSSPNNAPDVEIVSDTGVHLVYYNRNQPLPEADRPVTVAVPLLEQYWERVDGEKANREHLMMGLAELEYILIKATYTTNTQEAALTSVSLDTATTERNTAQSRAVEVELCNCPVGYRGTSCEECDAGFTRIEEGLYLGTCEPCSCNGFSNECDPDTGSCLNCRRGTTGHHCEQCIDGFQGDPAAGVPCRPVSEGCRCDPQGSVSNNCDRNQQCPCKTNVVGQSCNECRPGTFDLSQSNLDGCIECYCSGVSNDCRSSNLFREPIPMQIVDETHRFTLTDKDRNVVIREGIIINPSMNEISYDFTNQRQQTLFWSLPPEFTGNKVLSYGGNLNFTKPYTSLPNAPQSFDTDVVIVSPTITLFWIADDYHSPGTTKVYSIPLKENYWRRIDTSEGQRLASRADIMKVLSNIQAILIRAKHSDYTQLSSLSDVSLDTAVSQRTASYQVAAEVEVCRCPPGYRGTSCETCSTGYYKDFDGTCKECPCNHNEEHCALGPQQQVICTCKVSYGGAYCERNVIGPGVSVPPTTRPPNISISISDPTVIVIEAGRDVNFTCTARSLLSKPVDITWSKENGVLPQGRSYDTRRGILMIRDVQTYDAGTYICTASDGFTYVTESAMLNVGGRAAAPVVTVTPRTLEVYEGEPVEFRCEATGYPAPSVGWESERSNKFPPQSSFASGVFRIPYASLLDEGSFKCTARNSEGEDSATVYLSVRSAPQTPPPLPLVRLTIQPHDVSNGITGEVLRLECVASNPRNIRLQWSRQDGSMPSAARDFDGKLFIYNSQPEDSGIYTCTAVDTNTGSVVQEVRVRVNISPPQRPQPTISIDPPRQTRPQGSLVELRCFTSESPVQWSKAGDTLPPNAKIEGSILRIENVQVRDRGVYVCEVQGPGGLSRITSVLEVERREAPAVELHPRGSQTVIEDGSALFQCRVIQGIPDPTLHWSRVDGTPLSRHVEQLPNGVLRFNSVTRSDEGQYLCTADNQEGSATTVAVLEVHSMPVITITPFGQTIKVSPGQRVRLDCRATGHPLPTVSWSKHQPGYSFYDPKVITPETPQGAVYEIRDASLKDEGSYTCTARNSAGDVEERIHLTISDDQTSIPSTDIPNAGSGVYIRDNDYVVPFGGNVTILCLTQGPQPIDLVWVRRDQRPLSPNANVQNGELNFTYVQYSDAGEYSCQGVGSNGEVLFNAIAHLRVIEPSQIKLEPKKQVVKPGDNARITCTATGEQPIYISWHSANNQPLPPTVRVYSGVIEFMRIQESDAGRYICKAQNVRGTFEASADVIVKSNEGETSLRAIERNPVRIEGSSIELRCHTSGYPQITWTRENQPLPVGASVQDSTLRIVDLRMEDAGRYICRTDSYGFHAEDYIDLRVDRSNNVEVKIEPSKREVHYGDTVELRCLATGPPNVRIYWSRADGNNLPSNTIVSGEMLRITTATLENSATYKCTAFLNNNRFDNDYPLTVLDDRPSHVASEETVVARYGQTMRLECVIDLEGTITHDWTKHGGVLPSNAQVSGHYLIIPSVTYKDAGLYICTANNGIIKAEIPKIILVQGAVPFFPQAPQSYLALPTLSNAFQSFSIEITFKPENPNGLIIYNGQQYGGSGDFISFGLRDGLPEFRFDLGSGPGIVKGSQPLSLRDWHTVQLHRVKKEGSMYVDDGNFYSNISKGRMQGLDLNQPFYLGGVPDFSVIHKQNGFDSGFVGCISRLVLYNDEEIDIMKEEKDSQGVTFCETCAVNPCMNEGVCQEAPTRTGYTCLCPRGFSGLNCSHTGEPCYQGACGSGRCLDSNEGLECYCGLGKAGDRCERDVTISEPSFSRNSFLAYPTPKMLSKIKINVKFNPAGYSNGLLVYCAENDDGTGDFLSISIRDRYVEFKFDAGTGTTTLQSANEIVAGQWMTVNAGVTGRQATLSLTGESLPVSKEVPAGVFRFKTPLYVGGFDKQRIKPAIAVGVKQGFDGCITEVFVSSLTLDLIQSVVDSANIQQCSARHSDPCQQRPCQNNGVCHTAPDGRRYQCSCPNGFSGENCEIKQDICAAQQPCLNGGSCELTSTSYKCKCPIGYTGSDCEERAEFTTEVSFNGDGYVELSRNFMPHSNEDESEVILIEFSTTHPDGLLLWHGQTPETDGFGQDYLSLAVVKGFLQLSFEFGSSEPAIISSSSQVDDGRRHSAVIKRQGKYGSINLDRDLEEFGESGGLQIGLNTEGNIYIGGLPNIDYMTGSHGNYTGFNGCIHSLQIQKSGVINFAQQALSSVHTLPCTSSTPNFEEDEDEDENYDDDNDIGEEVVN